MQCENGIKMTEDKRTSDVASAEGKEKDVIKEQSYSGERNGSYNGFFLYEKFKYQEATFSKKMGFAPKITNL